MIRRSRARFATALLASTTLACAQMASFAATTAVPTSSGTFGVGTVGGTVGLPIFTYKGVTRGIVPVDGDVSTNTVLPPYAGAVAQTMAAFGGNALSVNMFGAAPRNGVTSDTPVMNAARNAATNGQVIHLPAGVLYPVTTIGNGPTNVVWQADGPLYKNNGITPTTAIGPYGDLLDGYLQFPNNVAKYISQTDPANANLTLTLSADVPVGATSIAYTITAGTPKLTLPGSAASPSPCPTAGCPYPAVGSGLATGTSILPQTATTANLSTPTTATMTAGTTITVTAMNASTTLRVDKTWSGGTGTVAATPKAVQFNCTQPGGGLPANTYQFSANLTCLGVVTHFNGVSGNPVVLYPQGFRDAIALADGLNHSTSKIWHLVGESNDLTNQASSVSGSLVGYEQDCTANGAGTNRFCQQVELSSYYKTGFAFAGDTNTSDAILRNVTNIYNLVEGQPVTGSGIPAGTAIAVGGINLSAGQVTLTQQPTAAASQVALTSGIVPGNFAYAMYIGTNDASKTPLAVSGDLTSGSVTVANVASATLTSMTVGRPIRGTGVPSGAYVASIGTTSFNLDVNHAATATATSVSMVQTTGANVDTFYKPDMPFNTAIIDTTTAQRNDPNAAEILMAANQRICLEATKTYCITENASVITVVAGGSVGLQVFGQAGFRPFATSGDPASPKVPGQLYFNSTANAYRIWSGSGSVWWTIPTLAQANTWTAQQMFSAGLSTTLGIYQKQAAAPATAPGAGNVTVFAVAGTNTGTCKLQAMAGTSTTPVTIVDNVGAGC